MKRKREPISARLRFEIFHRDNFTCQYCGQSAPDVVLHVEHRIPVAHGGTSDKENLFAACSACNLGKAARPYFVPAPVAMVQELPRMSEPEYREMVARVLASVDRAHSIAFHKQEFGRQARLEDAVLQAEALVPEEYYDDEAGEWLLGIRYE